MAWNENSLMLETGYQWEMSTLYFIFKSRHRKHQCFISNFQKGNTCIVCHRPNYVPQGLQTKLLLCFLLYYDYKAWETWNAREETHNSISMSNGFKAAGWDQFIFVIFMLLNTQNSTKYSILFNTIKHIIF